MSSSISGRITYANGRAAPDVEVRVYDQDAPGKGDDDLTVSAGLSDERGSFTVEFDPGRYKDFINLPFLGLRRPEGQSQGLRIPDPLDLLTPYLQFRYSLNGQQCTHTASIVPFQSHYQLPDALPISFQPARDGFQFLNLFKGYMLPFTLPFLPDASKVPGGYGLCGGMSAAACDYYLSGRPIPQMTETPAGGKPLQKYLFRRAIDSFAMGESILRFARWMALDQDGPNSTARLTMLEFNKLREALDAQKLAPLGLVLASGNTLQEIAKHVWDNHQVLACRYSESGDGSVDIHIYDPNYPRNDHVYLHCERVPAGTGPDGALFGLRCVRKTGVDADTPVRGFFPMPYDPVDPPDFG